MAVDFELLERRLLAELALSRSGTSTELRQRLGVSQPTFSRLVRRLNDKLLVTGRANRTRYAARRFVQDLAGTLPIYEVEEDGRVRRLAQLHAVLPEAYYVESVAADVPSDFHADLPYFLHDLRPAGFLGRLVPSQHPELALPSDVRLWSSNDALRYVARYGFDLPGALLVGDEALKRYLAGSQRSDAGVERRERKRRYPVLAADILHAGTPGSSAAGEQPKFLTTRGDGASVLVKFTPTGSDLAARRRVDLLLAEHLAHRVLSDGGEAAARSEILMTEEHCFLEVERFDRTAQGGRRGVMSLLALDAEFLGRMRSWSDSVERLARAGHLPLACVEPTRRRALFGRLIGNTDMHPGNLSFFARGAVPLELTPVYDMLPTLYAPQQGSVVEQELRLDVPSPDDTGVWEQASAMALSFWRAVAEESQASSGFRRIARQNAERVEAFRKTARLLPT